MPTLCIATRKSTLAIWQAEHVASRLRLMYPEIQVNIIGISTQGDKILDTPLAHIGGKGLFVKELEHSLLNNQADIAVHSMKDVPVAIPEGLVLGAILAREDPKDAFVSNQYNNLDTLPLHSIVGTSSLRRECQIRSLRPDLKILSLRGNVNTRLKRLDAEQYAAIILACAGLKRLGFDTRIRCQLSPEQILPAIGQGAIGIECRQDDAETIGLIAPLADPETTVCLQAERALNTHLKGGCQVPLAGYAVLESEQIYLRGLVGTPDGKQIIRAEAHSLIPKVDDFNNSLTIAQNLGIQVAEKLLSLGAKKILDEIM